MGIWENIFRENRKEDRKEDKSSKEASDEFLHSFGSPQERILSKGRITKSYELLGGATAPEVINIKDDGKAIMKKSYFEKNPTVEPNKERAAYIVDRFLGFNMAPITIVRGEGENTRSVQEFIKNAKTFTEITHKKSGSKNRKRNMPKIIKEHREDIMKVMMFDLLIGNIDRHFGNWIVANKTVYDIDHGLCFATTSSEYDPGIVSLSFSYPFCRTPSTTKSIK